MKDKEILLLGDIMLDTVFSVEKFPIPGRDSMVPKADVQIGGSVLNTAILLDNLNVSTALIGCLGKDIWAEKIYRELGRSNISLDLIQQKSKATTGITFIIATPDGERTMFSHRGVNTLLKITDINEQRISQSSILHLSGYAMLEIPQRDALWHAVNIANINHVPVCLDTGLYPVLQRPEDFKRLLPFISICISGFEETKELFNCKTPQDGAKELISLGVKWAAIKLGKEGCLIASNSEIYQFPSFEVEAVDTTGSGDSFTAGMIFGWINNLSLATTATLSNGLGALAATVYGAGFALPDQTQIKDFFAKNKRSKKNDIFSPYIVDILKAFSDND